MPLYLGGGAALNILMKLRTDCNIGRACLHDSQLKMIEITCTMTNAGSEKDNKRFIMDEYKVIYAYGKKPSDIQCIEGEKLVNLCFQWGREQVGSGLRRY